MKISKIEAARINYLENHPKNGVFGLWKVTGTKNEVVVKAKHALEAIEAAKGEVSSSEGPIVEFICGAPNFN